MQLSNIPDYRAHLSRHGHNLSHDFSFTSSTGHLLTVFAQHMNPEEHIKGHIDMFSRTQPLNGCPNADIDQYIDYFFVPYDMFWMGFGENFFQTNEPFSTAITINDGSLPLFDFTRIKYTLTGTEVTSDYPISTSLADENDVCHIYLNMLDSYGLDCMFMSAYRNMFHNFINPNVLFYPIAEGMSGLQPTLPNYQIPYDFFQPNVFPAVLLAYNCVYEHFYRIDDREVFDASIYNLDKYLIEGKTLNDVDGKKFFSLKYRPRHFDYFTAGSVAPLINPLNVTSGSNNATLLEINNYLSSSAGTRTSSLSGVPRTNTTVLTNDVGGVNAFTTNASTALNTSSLRSIFAVEKLLSVTNRAKKTYDAQVLAHFGVKVPKDVKHQIQFLGSQHGTIHIGEIISTANTVSGTTGSSLGDIAGKGYGNLDNKGIDFTAPCHGIVIGIYSCVPKVRYYVGTTKEWALTNRLDFYIPAYEHLGMQPIYRWEALQIPTGFAYQNPLLYQGSTKVLGWQMRYEQYKKQISRVSPAFARTINTSTVLGRVDATLNFNSWSNWLISERPFCPRMLTIKDSSATLELRDYLVNPCMLNDLFVYQYPDVRFNSVRIPTSDEGTGGYNDLNTDVYRLEPVDTAVSDRQSFAWNLATLFYFDPLLHFADVKMKLVSTMSDNTLPELAAV